MRKLHSVLAMVFVFVVLAGLCLPAAAHDVPDLTKTGSITVTLQYNQKPVTGGELAVYRVGEVYEEDGNYSFVPTEKYKAYKNDFTNLTSKKLSAELAGTAKSDSPAAKATVDAKGKAVMKELQLGLYLVVQSKESTGYASIEPFLVSVPYNNGGTYVYDVDAAPKPALKQGLIPSPTPTPKPTPTPPPKLPQTGQVNWPVPVLAVSGLTLFTIGWVLCFRKSDVDED